MFSFWLKFIVKRLLKCYEGKKIVEINEDLLEKFGLWIFLIWRSGWVIRLLSEEEKIKIEVFFFLDKVFSL